MNNQILVFSILIMTVAVGCERAGNAQTAAPTGEAVTASRNVSVAEADALLRKDKNIVILDVRTPDEFAEGHMPGARNLDYSAADFKAKLAELNHDQTYLVHCRSGGRSARAVALMKEMQFKSVLHLNEGFMEWEDAEKPVEK